MKFRRVILMVMDGCGAGAAPDAALFGDAGPTLGDTLVHISQSVGALRIPYLRKLGLGNALPLVGGDPDLAPIGGYGRLQERSMGGKDTVTGHWEMMGIVTEQRFPTYPQGFPTDLIAAFEKAIGRPTLGNYASSGTVVLKELGEKHLATGYPIVYTSADSVFQIACHQPTVSLDELYGFCHRARELLSGEWGVQRVIARPFEGTSASDFRRTGFRKDFPLSPPANVLDALAATNVFVGGIGVIPEVFDHRGFTFSERTQSNPEHHRATLGLLERNSDGFIFVNYEDFDMLYGHRNDPEGFGAALEQFDGYVGDLVGRMTQTDLLLICADHGNDPTTPTTDHSREYSPLLVYSPGLPGGRDYGIRSTFADIGATVAAVFGVDSPAGTSLI
jgi:phosphopentomutase